MQPLAGSITQLLKRRQGSGPKGVKSGTEVAAPVREELVEQAPDFYRPLRIDLGYGRAADGLSNKPVFQSHRPVPDQNRRRLERLRAERSGLSQPRYGAGGMPLGNVAIKLIQRAAKRAHGPLRLRGAPRREEEKRGIVAETRHVAGGL